MNKLVSLFIAARLYVLALPAACWFTGAGLNQVVLAANGGKFPVQVNERSAKYFGFETDGFSDNDHYRMSDKTHLNWLADWINMHTVIYSPGDLLMMLGEMLSRFSNVVWATLIIGDIGAKQRPRRLTIHELLS